MKQIYRGVTFAVRKELDSANDIRRHRLAVGIFSYLKALEGGICKTEPEVRNIIAAMEKFSQKEKNGSVTGQDRTEIMGLLRIELKRKGIYGHSRRVAGKCRLLGEKLGLKKEECDLLYFRAFLHDVGKMFVPRSLIEKPDKLEGRELEQMQMHSGFGAWLAGKTAWFSPLAKPIMQHQEKIDGSGYPDGLKGEEISLDARIIAVVDSYDAMVDGKRNHKKQLAHETAIEELRRGKGTHFDPEIVEAFIEMLGERNAMRKTG